MSNSNQTELNNLPHYSRSFRILEYVSLFSFVLLWILQIYRALSDQPDFFMGCLAMSASWLVADFISGIVHWFADTWGTSQWPIVGPTLIRSFREHHFDAKAITRHDFVETNGASAIVCLPLLIALIFYQANGFFFYFILFFTLWILFTNQFHKWSHEENPPEIVKRVQNTGLILGIKNHARHHSNDHDAFYFITSGFLNHIIKAKHFSKIEKQVTQATGLIPREDDSSFCVEK